MSLATEIVRDVNQQENAHGINIARKSMIFCELSLDTNGIWRCDQLFQELQDIIVEFPNHFDGEQVLQFCFPKKNDWLYCIMFSGLLFVV